MLDVALREHWRQRFIEVLAPPRRMPTDAELGRLTAVERTELLALLEKATAGVPTDTRTPISSFLVDAVMDGADDAAEPEVHLTVLLAHERAKRRHMKRLADARGSVSTDIAEFLKAFNQDTAESERCAIADGFPPPAKPVPRPILRKDC